MQVILESLPGLERRLKITVSAEKIDAEVEDRLKKLVKEVKLDGFRPGKVPMAVIKTRYTDAVRGEVMAEMVRYSYFDALQQEELNPAGDPHMELTQGEAGKPLEFTATFEVYPLIKLSSLEGVAIEELQAEVTDNDINQMLEKLRKQYAQWEESDRPAQTGDRVEIDFVGTMDGTRFEGGTAEEVKVELGSGRMIPGFEEGIVGLKTDDTKELDIKFPENYHMADFAGKPVKFAVKLRKVLVPQLAVIDDAFVKKMGIKEGGVDRLRADIRNNMERELKRALRNQVKSEILEKFLEKNSLDLPKVLVESEIERLQQQAKQQFQAQSGAKQVPELPRDRFEELAKTRVGLGLLFAEFIKEHQLEPDASRVRQMIEEAANVYQQPEQIIAWYYSNKEQLAHIEAMALEEQVVDMLLGQVQKVAKSATFDEVMNPETERSAS